MNEKPVIALPNPRGSWLLHCTDANGDLGVCNVTVERGGTIAIYAPNDCDTFSLDGTEIAEFRAAFTEAVELAEVELRERRRHTVTCREGSMETGTRTT